jgi:hypothetical protein
MYDTPRQSPPLFRVEEVVHSGTYKMACTLDFAFQSTTAATYKSTAT